MGALEKQIDPCERLQLPTREEWGWEGGGSMGVCLPGNRPWREGKGEAVGAEVRMPRRGSSCFRWESRGRI